jgi:hypothetical protein
VGKGKSKAKNTRQKQSTQGSSSNFPRATLVLSGFVLISWLGLDLVLAPRDLAQAMQRLK